MLKAISSNKSEPIVPSTSTTKCHHKEHQDAPENEKTVSPTTTTTATESAHNNEGSEASNKQQQINLKMRELYDKYIAEGMAPNPAALKAVEEVKKEFQIAGLNQPYISKIPNQTD